MTAHRFCSQHLLLLMALSCLPAWGEPGGKHSAIEERSQHVHGVDANGAPADIDVTLEGPSHTHRGIANEFEVRVENQSARARDVVVDVDMSRRFHVVSSSPRATHNNDGLTWSLGPLGEKETRWLRFQAVSEGSGRERIRARAREHSADVALPVSFRAQEEPPTIPEPSPAPAVTIRIEGPERARVDEAFQCEAIISNQGKAALANAGFSLNLTQGLRLVKKPEAGQGPLDLAPGAEIRVPLELVASQPGVQGVRAQVEADGGINQQVQRDIRIEPQGLSVRLEGPAQHAASTVLRYRLYIANNLPAATPDTQAFIEIPNGLEIVSAEAGALFNRRTRTIRWPIGTIPANEERGFRVTLRPQSAGTFQLSARVQGANGQTSQTTSQTQILGHSSIALVVEPSLELAPVGELITVAIDLRGKGSQPASDVVVRVDKSPGLEFDPARNSGWSEVEGAWETRLSGDLSMGSTERLNLTLRASQVGSPALRVAVKAKEIQGEIMYAMPIVIIPREEDAEPTRRT